MNETDWLACTNPQAMLEFLRGKVSERKLRLFACACCRRVWPLFNSKRLRAAVEASERYADGLATSEEMEYARSEAQRLADRAFAKKVRALPWAMAVQGKLARHTAMQVASANIQDVIEVAGSGLGVAKNRADYEHKVQQEQLHQSILLRDVVGPLPFRPVTVNPAWFVWNSGTVRQIAQGIYDDRTFDRLPILADALEDAGCTNPDILNHCRQPGEHARGCWLLDLLLARQ